MTRRSKLCYCDVCGVSSIDKPVVFYKKFNMLLCGKHGWQMRKYGSILDASCHNRFDKNLYYIEDDIVHMDLCDKFQKKICETLFDAKYLDDVTKRKWRTVDKNGRLYVSTKATPEEGTAHITLHRYIAKLAGMDVSGFEIDHINGDTMDNRECNLRLATRREQTTNIAPQKTNKLNIRGVSFSKRDKKYVVDFSMDHLRFYFKRFESLPEAVYIRYLMEKHFFDDIAVQRHLSSIQPYINALSESQKRDLEAYVQDIIDREEVKVS